MREHIGLIIILFHPSAEEIRRTISLSHDYRGAIVDNSPNRLTDQHMMGRMHYFHDGSNHGVAAAQNIGLRMLLQQKDIRYIVMLDQDSEVAPDYPERIASEFVEVSKTARLSALGALVVNKHDDVVYRSKIHRDRYLNETTLLRDEVISSGTCFSADAFRAVGLNDEWMFIDYVDTEWCFRARVKGYVCAVTEHVRIRHQVGLGNKYIFGHIVIVSKPFRYFYQVRNLVYLLNKPYVPFSFKRNRTLKAFLQFVCFPFYVNGGWKCSYHMAKGFLFGLYKLLIER